MLGELSGGRGAPVTLKGTGPDQGNGADRSILISQIMRGNRTNRPLGVLETELQIFIQPHATIS